MDDGTVVVVLGVVDVVLGTEVVVLDSEVDVGVPEVLVPSSANAAGETTKEASAPANTTPATRLSDLTTASPNDGYQR